MNVNGFAYLVPVHDVRTLHILETVLAEVELLMQIVLFWIRSHIPSIHFIITEHNLLHLGQGNTRLTVLAIGSGSTLQEDWPWHRCDFLPTVRIPWMRS